MEILSDARVQFGGALVLMAALSALLVSTVLRRQARRLDAKAPAEERRVWTGLLRAAGAPLILATWCWGLQFLADLVIEARWLEPDWAWARPALLHVGRLGLFASGLWFFHRLTRVLDARLQHLAGRTTGRLDDVLLPLFGTALRVTVPVLAAFLLVQLWPVSAETMGLVRKLLGIALVGAVAWTLRRAIVLVDAALLGTQGWEGATTAAQRALFTRVRLLRRVALVLISLFAFAAVLMMFDEVRDVGRSILASAGIAGIVLGFAAQRTLGNLFAGIQIALTQPIRLGDQVIVEGEFATIEEITLTYVVARAWDGRRVVLPISYFIEKPFQNWTRASTALLAPLEMQVDFSLPVEPLRRYLEQEVAKSRFWDRKSFGLQVVDSDARSMKIRVLASAPDSGASWDLRCELREKAIDFIRRNFPQCLPKLRQEQRRVQTWRTTVDGDGPGMETASDGQGRLVLAAGEAGAGGPETPTVAQARPTPR